MAWQFVGKKTREAGMENGGRYARKNYAARLKGERPNNITYEEISDGVDLEYIAGGDRIKENIIIKARQEDYNFLFKFNISDLKIRLSADKKSIEFVSSQMAENGQAEKVEYIIPAPFMTDAAGAYSDEAYYEINEDEAGGFELKVVAEPAWINADERVFPVTIDPQIIVPSNSSVSRYYWFTGNTQLYSNTTGTCYVGYSGSSGGSTGSYTINYYYNRIYFSAGNLSVRTGHTVTKAEVRITQSGSSGSGYIGLYEAYAHPSASLKTSYPVDFVKIKPNKADDNEYAFDISSIYNDSGFNFALKDVLETGNYGSITINSNPYFVVYYKSACGVSGDFSYNTHSVGRAGQGNVNLLTGALTFVHKDVEWSGNKMPADIFHVYNSVKYSANGFYPESVFSSANVKMLFGKGWKLNYQQYVIPNKKNSILRNGSSYIYYNNGGTAKYLYKYSGELFTETNSNATYSYDEKKDVLQYKNAAGKMEDLILTNYCHIYYDEYGREIFFKHKKDKDGNTVSDMFVDENDSGMEYNPLTHTLARDGKLYVFTGEAANFDGGILSRIEDEHGNRLVIDIGDSPNYRITAITDGAGRKFKFGYSGEYLNNITNEAGNETYVSYFYANDSLYQIGYLDGTVTEYTYASDLLSAAINRTAGVVKYGVYYQYSSSKIHEIKEMSGGDTTGRKSTYSYNTASRVTTVANYDSDTGKTMNTCYVLDSEGKVTNSYFIDPDICKVMAKGVYLDGINPFAADSSPDINYNIVNLFTVKTHFADTPMGWYTYSYASAFGSLNSTVPTNFSNDSFIGRSVTVVGGTGGAYGIGRTETLKAGTYTVSAHFKNATVLSGSEGMYVEVSCTELNSKPAAVRMSEFTKETYGRFVRVSHTFTITSQQSVTLLFGVRYASGTALVSAPQLEKGEFANSYNMLVNGGFEYTSNNAIVEWSQCVGVAPASSAGAFEGLCGLKATNTGAGSAYACQTVKLNGAKDKLERFVLSACARGFSPILKDDVRKFELRAEIFYADRQINASEEPEVHSESFAPTVPDWQFRTLSFEKGQFRAIDYINIYVDYSGNIGEVYFDSIQLTPVSVETIGANYFGIGGETASEESSDSAAAPAETPAAKTDEYGNSLGSVNYMDGNVGAIYKSFDYAHGGNDISAESDERLNKTLYEYDEARSRVTKVTAPERTPVSYEYHPNGDLVKSVGTNLNGTEVETEYEYDYAGNLTKMTRNGFGYDIGYTGFGQLESIGVGNSGTALVGYTYKNGNGKLKKITYANGIPTYTTARGTSFGVSTRPERSSITINI
jgi:hypothetical protein